MSDLEKRNQAAIELEAYNEGFRDGQMTMGNYYRPIIKQMRCCGNCKNEKYLERTFEFTVCKDCNNLSNWEMR